MHFIYSVYCYTYNLQYDIIIISLLYHYHIKMNAEDIVPFVLAVYAIWVFIAIVIYRCCHRCNAGYDDDPKNSVTLSLKHEKTRSKQHKHNIYIISI
jgi:hypothetical protein